MSGLSGLSGLGSGLGNAFKPNIASKSGQDDVGGGNDLMKNILGATSPSSSSSSSGSGGKDGKSKLLEGFVRMAAQSKDEQIAKAANAVLQGLDLKA